MNVYGFFGLVLNLRQLTQHQGISKFSEGLLQDPSEVFLINFYGHCILFGSFAS